jgi:hypothetical protein
MRLDEILALLPEVQLRLGLMQEKAGDPSARWYVMVAEAEFGPDATRWDGWGAAPLEAMLMALRRAGVDASDDS